MLYTLSALLSFASLFCNSAYAHYGRLRDAPVENGLCDPTVKSLSGYFEISQTYEKNYFYWFFESRSEPSNDPLIIWLTGGPGCSSQLALLSENGPCTPTPDGLDTIPNPYSWNNNANIMWIDQPSGVGFSYGDKRGLDSNETEVAEDLYNFLQEFFKAHNEYLPNEFFVFGESYGGHFVPAISSRIYAGNKKQEGLHINLQGLGIGNGLTDPVIQYQYYPQMAMNNTYDIKCVSEESYEKMLDHVPSCTKFAEACQLNVDACEPANTYCNLFETTPYYSTGLNPYDIRKPCGDSSLCYDFSNIETFLNLNSTREALHVSDKAGEWTECNNAVNAMFAADWMRNFQQNLIPLLEDNVRVLIYAGDVDFICNWMGNKAWTIDLPWSGKNTFSSTEDYTWSYKENTAGGLARSASASSGEGSLTFLQVYEAGHMVPYDQPEVALSMLNTFLENKAFY